MALRYGTTEALGNLTYDRDRSPFLQPIFPVPQERSYSEGTGRLSIARRASWSAAPSIKRWPYCRATVYCSTTRQRRYSRARP
jgi:hypothetical protein